MTYELIFRQTAVRDLDQIDSPTRKRIITKLAWFANQSDPLLFAHRLTNSELGTFRYRIGAWRIVIDAKDDQLIVLRVGHRREIYR
ncbi:type II toxin-antitoxin system RelE/ParE family toxin [Candidatus Berkelbacteria bacterium]|nr:type II toxin-antitoxin system RelE/ParE family toxin [Candidatus Berkelbacteria bacterium]